ncbi:NAD-dependent epimerase/dehydratase family protein [Gammaproteobacteria bacterium]|nr:NAD-dependent epimerase/dehydratase family protein [Gammaproteobacteria bacterium]
MKIAVLGGNGYLGGRVATDLSEAYDVTIVTRRPFVLKNCDNLVLNFREIFFHTLSRFDVIVNCVGGNRDEIEADPENANELKQNLINNLCDLSEIKKIFVLHVSSKHVYSVVKHRDVDNHYALSHLNAEKMLEKKISGSNGSGYQILRLANCFGSPASNSQEFSRLFLNQIITGILKKNECPHVRNPKTMSSFVPLSVVSSYLKEIFRDPFSIQDKVIDLGMPYSFFLGDAEKIVREIFSGNDTKKNIFFVASSYGESFIKRWPEYADFSYFVNEVNAFKLEYKSFLK